VIVFVAKYFIYLSVAILALFWWRSTKAVKIQLTIRLVVGGIIALVVADIAAHVYYDPRPFVVEHVTPLFAHAADNGFPSDHALFTSFIGFTVWAYSRTWGAALLVIAVAVGVARVAAHVHAPLDIVGSFVFSGLAALATVALTRRRFTRDRSNR
jgi:undecaprenyl-diphosphatase